MPSIHEGLPFVAVEAQASGLPCVFSDGVTREAKLLDSCSFIPFSEKPDVWAKEIVLMLKNYKRHDVYRKIIDAGYDMPTEVKKLEKFYERAFFVGNCENCENLSELRVFQ